MVFTYDRVDGKQFATNTLTFELSPWEIHYENNQLYWCVPNGDNTNLLACSYDKNGKLVSSKLITPLANEHESLDVCESEGTTKVFFVDSSYQPMRIAAEFESCLIFEE